MEHEDFLFFVSRLAMASRLSQESAFLQHGVTRCLLHSIAVAYYCDRLAGYLQALRFQRRQLLRGYTTISSTTGTTRTPPTGSTVFITPPGPLATPFKISAWTRWSKTSSCATCSP